MLSLATYALMASGALAAAGTVQRRWEYPQGMPLVARQDPGTPAYLCHENCGTLITLARENPTSYCSLDEYNQRFQSCMECSLTFNIWRYYTGSVTPAATACGLVIAPSPSGWEPTVTSTTPPAEPSVDPVTSSTEDPVVSSTEEPAASSTADEPVSEPSVPAEPSSTEPPVAGSSVEPSASVTEDPAVSSTEEPAVSSTEEPAASSTADEPAASSDVEEPSSSGDVPYPVPSGSDAPYPVPTGAETTTSIYIPVGGNQTTLCTTTASPVASGSGYVPPGADYTGTYSPPKPSESFQASGASKVVGSFCAAGVAVAAMLAAF